MLFGTPYLLSFQFFVIVFYTCYIYNIKKLRMGLGKKDKYIACSHAYLAVCNSNHLWATSITKSCMLFCHHHAGCHMYNRAGATGTVRPVLAGPIFVRKRGRDKLCTNTLLYE